MDFKSLPGVPGVDLDGSDVVRSLTRSAEVLLFFYSPQHHSLVSWTANVESLVGAAEIEIISGGNLFLRYVHPDDRFAVMDQLERALRGESEYRCTYRWIRPDNQELRWLHCRGSLNTSAPAPVFEGALVDLTAEIAQPPAAAAGGAGAADILTSLPFFVLALDSDLRIISAHIPAATSDSELAGFALSDQSQPISALRPGVPLAQSFPDAGQWRHYHSILHSIIDGSIAAHTLQVPNGSRTFLVEIRPLQVRGAVAGAVIFGRDASDAAARERELSGLKRAAGGYLLSAGVAHGINNALQSMLGQAALLNRHAADPQLVRTASRSILELARRSADLCQELLSLDSAGTPLLVPADLDLAVLQAVNAVHHSWPGEFKVGVVLGNPGLVLARRTDVLERLVDVFKLAHTWSGENRSMTVRTQEGPPRGTLERPVRCGEVVVSFFPSTAEPVRQPPERERRQLEQALGGLGGALCLEEHSARETEIHLQLPLAGL